jgi:hypothetical protein
MWRYSAEHVPKMLSLGFLILRPALPLCSSLLLVERSAYHSQGGEKLETRQLTNEPHPTPQLRDLQREILQYKRADGVSLNAELFLPPHYDPTMHGRLPCILWAYPRCATLC